MTSLEEEEKTTFHTRHIAIRGVNPRRHIRARYSKIHRYELQ